MNDGIELSLFLVRACLDELFKSTELNYATSMEFASASLKSPANGASKLFHS